MRAKWGLLPLGILALAGACLGSPTPKANPSPAPVITATVTETVTASPKPTKSRSPHPIPNPQPTSSPHVRLSKPDVKLHYSRKKSRFCRKRWWC